MSQIAGRIVACQTRLTLRPAQRLIIAVMVLGLIYIGTVATIGLSGDFPLNDDWAYAVTTRDFVRTGVFTPSSWSAASLIFEVLLASPACMMSHCGSDDLRVVTQILSVVLLGASFVLVQQVTRNLFLTVVASVLVVFNPVTYSLSFTFMTDICFSAMFTIAAVFFIRSFLDHSARLVVLGTLFALAATLTRQLGLCLPLAYLVVRLACVVPLRKWRAELLGSALPVIVCSASLIIFKHWLLLNGRLSALYEVKTSDLLNTLRSPVGTLLRLGHNLSTIVLYMGLFTLPMLLITARSTRRGEMHRRTRWLAATVAGAVLALSLADLLSLHRIMPSSGNILAPQGIGPALLRDVVILGLPNLPPLPEGFWIVVTVLSLGGAFLLVNRLMGQALELGSSIWHRRLDPRQACTLFLYVAILAYLAPILLISFYDRYLVPILPLTLAVIATSSADVMLHRFRSALAGSLCAMVAMFAVLATHDYMTWNRARWRAIFELEHTNGISSASVDGGLEYNGLRGFRPDYVPRSGRSWWWVVNDEYEVSFGNVPEMRILASFPFQTWLPPGQGSIKILVRDR